MSGTILDLLSQLLLQLNTTKSLTNSSCDHQGESLMLEMTKFWGCLSWCNVMLCNQNPGVDCCRTK